MEAAKGESEVKKKPVDIFTAAFQNSPVEISIKYVQANPVSLV